MFVRACARAHAYGIPNCMLCPVCMHVCMYECTRSHRFFFLIAHFSVYFTYGLTGPGDCERATIPMSPNRMNEILLIFFVRQFFVFETNRHTASILHAFNANDSDFRYVMDEEVVE